MVESKYSGYTFHGSMKSLLVCFLFLSRLRFVRGFIMCLRSEVSAPVTSKKSQEHAT